MVMPLLTTKLHIPPIRRELVPRPRLIERLNAGLDRKLTLVSAPAGFGKTTLLSEWIAGCAQTEPKVRVAWLSLDEGDNDPLRFWAHSIAALQTVQPAVGKSALTGLQSPQAPPIEAFLTGLINEIAEIPDPLAFVLDDFYCVEADPIHHALAFLLEHLPPQMHLIIATRSDPPLSLSRLRGRGQLSELRTADLRFAEDEAAAFLNDVMGLGLSPEDVAALEERTEGWIVGLHMASLAMRGRSDLSGFIKAFSGSHRFILDYLGEEVLAQQSPDVQEFLLKTSILERMTAPLCDAVTARDDSQTILTYLEGANLFLVPLDDERRWYRYHQLFADLLRSRLEQTQPAQVPALHLRASEWYETNGLLPEAVAHAFAAEDVDRVATMLEGNALSLITYGRLKTSLGWLKALPPEMVRSRPWLCVAYAWALAYKGSFTEALACLDGLDAEARAVDLSGKSAYIAGHINAIRFYVASVRPLADKEAEQYAHRALAMLPESDVRTRSLVAVLLGMLQRMNFQYAAARETLSGTLALARASGQEYAMVDLLCQLARVEATQGYLNRSAAICRKALQMAEEYGRVSGERLPVVSYAHVTLASILREWNQLDDAKGHAEAAIDLSRQWGHPSSLVNGYIALLSIHLALGDIPSALNTVRKMRQLDTHVRQRYSLWLETWELKVRLAVGDVDSAARWADDRDLTFPDASHWMHSVMNLVLAKMRIAQFNRGTVQNLDDTIAHLAVSVERMEMMESWRGTIELLILQSIALQAIGEDDRAIAALARALSLAEPEGYVRTFIDEGEPMAILLRQAAGRGIAVEYMGKLLSEWAKESARSETAGQSPSLPTGVEPLTEREWEVLRLLAIGLSNREIAEQLFLAVGTVKKYTSNIYGKLSVHSRTQAAAKARELGLL
jgi:LuxR family maltose regulon positive regulatory protein